MIRELSERHLESARRHQPTDATWAFVGDSSGEPIVQIDTYGSDQRKLRGKSRQSIQVDREMAKQLVEVLRRAYPGL